MLWLLYGLLVSMLVTAVLHLFFVLVGLMRVAALTHAELCLWFGTAGLTGCVYNLCCRSVSLSTIKLAVLACFAS